LSHRANCFSVKLKEIYSALGTAVSGLKFGLPTTHVYNPLQYAWDPVEQYLEMAGVRPKNVVFLGMNPGPFGMAQTGVPFGTVKVVRDWLGIEGRVGKPPLEHPKRPVLGFDCGREEISGMRFWGWARDRYVTPGRFFERYFVANYCPLVFMEESGRNRTPDKLAVAERKALFHHCDAALLAVIETLQPQMVIGIGKFAEDRAKAVLSGSGIKTGG
jgi:single-strand selective monofunctional uracil DNA glycosylase